MKSKSIILLIVSTIIGIITGIFITVHLFAIDIDLLGVPYFNKPVITTKDIIADQRNIRITIPKGAKLVHKYDAKDQSFYSIPLVEIPHQINSYVKSYDKQESFYITGEAKKADLTKNSR